MQEAASPLVTGYHPARALSGLVRGEQGLHSPAEILAALKPVQPAPISSGPGFYITRYVNLEKREDPTLLSHSGVFPASFILTTPGFGREHARRCSPALPPGHSVFSSSAGYPQTCEGLRSQPPSQQR